MRTLWLILLCTAGVAAVAPAWASDPPHAAAPTATQQSGQAAPAGGAAHGADGHGHKTPGIWEGGVGNSIITLIIFGIVLYVLGTKAWPVLIRSLSEREHAIRVSIENARKERLEAEKLLAKYQAQIDRAREEATAIVEEGRRDSEQVRQRMQEEARKEAAEMLARAKREIQLATDAAVKELYDRSVELSIQIASGVLRRQLSPEDHKDLVRQALDEIRAGGKSGMN